MAVAAALLGVIVIVTILWEGFEAIILPRRVTRRFRLTVAYYRVLWGVWKAIGRRVGRRNQESWLGVFGPLSLLVLLAVWAAGVIVGFALLYWATAAVVHASGTQGGILAAVYLSGSAFFSAPLSDVLPATGLGRVLAVVEAALGFGLLALVISYLPPLNQSFSRREVNISLLDARAGSPPSATAMLARHRDSGGTEALRGLLREWERWSAELLESHQSYPVLAYFRSQHDSQSWLGALTAVLDACTLVMAGLEGECRRQAQLTFAVARHAVVDLCLVFRRRPRAPAADRLPAEALAEVQARLAASGMKLRTGEGPDRELRELRQMYEPYVATLAEHFSLQLPPWVTPELGRDDWEVSEWEGRGEGKGQK